MPLKCHSGSDEIYAFNFSSDDEWNALKSLNAAQKHLKMPCCQANVVLRTSKLGTRHFAHARKGTCTTAPETAEHLLAKLEVVNGIKLTEWEAFAEQSGSTPQGETWRADVLATYKKLKVAFEIQWSHQDHVETRRRQKRYDEAGVRGLWLFKQIDFPLEKETPSFCLRFDEINKAFDVLIACPRHHSIFTNSRNPNYEYWSQRIPLTIFASGALEGRLRFGAAVGKALPLLVFGSRVRCTQCKKHTNVVTDLTIKASRVLPGHPDILTTIYDYSNILDELDGNNFPLLNSALMLKYGIGPVQRSWSPALKKTYTSNGCVHCNAMQGQFFALSSASDSGLIFETEICLQPEWMPRLPAIEKHLNIWWFEEDSVLNDSATDAPVGELFSTPIENSISAKDG